MTNWVIAGPGDRGRHIRMLQGYITSIGRDGKFWCGEDDTQYPISRYQEIMGCSPTEAVKSAMGHLRRHVAILEAS